jgi:prepilin signal peptidase PulO-like enzyme (type II secretory pathway)
MLYPVIEITTGVLFAAIYMFVISNSRFLIFNQIVNPNSLIINHLSLITMFYYLFIMSSFIVIFFTDLKYGIIPDKILLPAVVVALLYLIFISPQLIVVNFLSGIGAFLFFMTIYLVFSFLVKKTAMGGGDIKLAFLLGLFLGFPNTVVSLYLAFLTGAILGIILILWRKKSFQNATLPFGPFLVLGAVISFFFGNLIYLQALHFLGL